MAAATLSQRISFSHDLDLSPTGPAANNAPRRLDASLMLTSPSSSSSSDFDFSTSHEISAAPADELFAHGMLLPLSAINRQNIQNEPEKIKRPESPKTLNLNHSSSSPPSMNTKPPPSPSSPSFWANIRRSSSVGTVSKSRPASICPFPRSKSTGSYPNPNPNPNQSQKMRNSSKRSQSQSQSQSQNQNRNEKSWYNYYYSRSSKRSSHRNGVRINPVINVPAHFIPRGGSSGSSGGGDSGGKNGGGGGGGGNSFFAYLLCNCNKELGNYSP